MLNQNKNRLFLLIVIVCIGIVALNYQPATTRNVTQSLDTDSASVEQSVTTIAKSVTVRILTNPGAGSGVIIARVGQTYTVLTCAHVVELSQNFTVLTPDGKTHKALRVQLPKLNGVDLAVMQFQSRIPYRVAVLSRFTSLKEIAVGVPAYASGFPNYQNVGANDVKNTLNWGLRAYRFTTGKVSMLLLDKSLQGGYQLGYTNDIELGMSGGPVLDQQGQLIGINGWSKYPFQGIDVFGFSDATVPSQIMFERMEALSWAIPISTFLQKVGEISSSATNL